MNRIYFYLEMTPLLRAVNSCLIAWAAIDARHLNCGAMALFRQLVLRDVGAIWLRCACPTRRALRRQYIDGP